MLATGNVFATAASRAVSSNDARAVTQTIRAIGRTPGFIYAAVRGHNGSLLAEIGVGARLQGDLVLTSKEHVSPFSLLGTHTLTVKLPVVDGGAPVGEIELVASLDGLAERFASTLLYSLLVSVVALAVGLAFAVRLGRALGHPLELLTRAMLSVDLTGHDTEPVAIVSDDETGLLAQRFNTMLAELRAATVRILDREKEIIERLSKAGEMRDDQTGQHVIRVAQISRLIATEIGLTPVYVDDLCRASPMHDVGKISISDAILHKPGRLNADERQEMERHARRGYEILEGSKSDLVQLAAEIAISHHERWDGNGYPEKLSGSAIPFVRQNYGCSRCLRRSPFRAPV